MSEDRRDRGQGSITPHGDGWRARLPCRYDRRSLGVFATTEAATEILDAALADLEREPSTELSLDAWAETVLQARADGDHKRRTVERDRTRWGTYVRGTLLGKTPLLDVDEGDVRRWLGGLKKRDGSRLAPTSARNALSLVRVVLEAAREAQKIKVNPATGVRLSAPARAKVASRREVRWLTQPEIDRLLACDAIPIRSRAAFAVAIYTGMRAGELWGLRWENVTPDAIHVRHSFETTPKTHQIRTVPLLAPAREWLDRWRVIYDGAGVRSRHGLVWPAQDEAWHADGYDAGWADRWREEAKIKKAVFHDLRHTCASHLLQGTWAPTLIERALRLEEVRDWLGHKTIATTQIYAHLCADRVRSLVVRPADIGTRSGHDPEPLRGFEPRTYGLRNRGGAPVLRQELAESVAVSRDVSRSDLRGLAVRTLRAIERGDARALSMAVDVCAGVLEATAGEQDEEQTA